MDETIVFFASSKLGLFDTDDGASNNKRLSDMPWVYLIISGSFPNKNLASSSVIKTSWYF